MSVWCGPPGGPPALARLVDTPHYAASTMKVAVLAAACGGIVADALRQETTTSYPLPVRRAYGFGAATALTLAGVGMGLLCLRDLPLGWLIGAVAAVVVAVVMFAQLAATQTNRHKPWVMRMNAEYGHAGDRFS